MAAPDFLPYVNLALTVVPISLSLWLYRENKRLTRLTHERDLQLKLIELHSFGERFTVVEGFELETLYLTANASLGLFTKEEDLRFRQLQVEVSHLRKLLGKTRQ